ncbi:hypothetical protein [Mycobacterium paragordonae]|uniref:Uncharacterized protein n=1 Tax=Mycobacterium paragordonae TaxID=1389713 RepID=A0AAJ1W4J8_9MYCO|nr:hypothetical protein [Mycobacterium paragordonae]MDP7737643.1 hypothetical protein [Mycobacterium paragordonae]
MTTIISVFRRCAHMFKTSLHMTAQERADAYVGRSPIAVLA